MLRPIADGEKIEVPDAGARADRARRRAAPTATPSRRSTSSRRRPRARSRVQAVLQLLGAVEEEALFRLCDLVVDRDTAGALTFVEELADAGTGSRPARARPARAPARTCCSCSTWTRCPSRCR